MAVTITDIARRSGVAKSTVSRVLNRKTTAVAVSDTTRRLVEKVAHDLNYRPSFSARALTSGKTRTLGLVCGDFQSPYVSEMVAAEMVAAEARGYHVLVSVTQWNPEKELQCLEMLLERRVEGILGLTDVVRPGNEYYEYFKKERFPMVLQECDYSDVCTLAHDWQAGLDEAVAYLKARGHRSVGFVRQETRPTRDYKMIGFAHACQKHQIAAVTYDCGVTLDCGKEVGRRIALDANRPSALIVYSDYLANGIIYGLRKQGVSIPEDMAVIGMDGMQLGEVYYPPLTTIDTDITATAEAIVDLVLRQVEDRNRAPEQLVLPTRLLVRESA